MADEYKFLTGDDVKVLKEVVEYYRKVVKAGQKLPTNEIYSPAPPMYMAEVPVGGIAALDTGTGEPGSAECNIFKLVDGVMTDAGFTETVYNASLSSITQASASYISAQRDSYGTWWAMNSSGNGTGTAALEDVDVVVAVFPNGDTTKLQYNVMTLSLPSNYFPLGTGASDTIDIIDITDCPPPFE